jgi:hypothetical protein
MPDGIIRDPRQNPEKESDFGILYAYGEEEYYLYYKEDFELDKDKRYFIAGTEINFDGNPMDLTKKRFKYKTDVLNVKIDTWVKIKDNQDPYTGEVVKQINEKIKGNINFPSLKEYLSDYTDNIT